MGIFSEIFKIKNRDDEENLLIKKEVSSDNILESPIFQEKKDIPDGAFINENGEIEYEVVELVIRPEKIICPDCGGITLEGLEYCDKCGGEI